MPYRFVARIRTFRNVGRRAAGLGIFLPTPMIRSISFTESLAVGGEQGLLPN